MSKDNKRQFFHSVIYLLLRMSNSRVYYELRASGSEQMLITHSSLLTAKKISFNVAGMKLFLNIAT